MVSPEGISQVTSLIYAVTGLISAIGITWNLIVSRRNVAVSSRNEGALRAVRDTQVSNRSDLTAAITAVRHDLHNGAGDRIAEKVVIRAQPIIEETGRVITEQVTSQIAQTAAEVAVALVEKKAWEGEERRQADQGPPTGTDERRK